MVFVLWNIQPVYSTLKKMPRWNVQGCIVKR